MKQSVWQRGDLRLLIVGVVFVFAWGGIGFRLFDLQNAQAEELAGIGFNQRISTESIQAPRGTIYDRDGVELAMTIDGWNVVVDPSMLDDPQAVAAVLAPYSDAPWEELQQTLVDGQAEGDRYAEIAMRVDTEHKDTIVGAIEDYNAGVDRRNRIVGVFYREQPLRVYPADSVAAQVIGLTRYDDGAGIEGLERTFDSELDGVDGKKIVERSLTGQVIPQGDIRVEEAEAGSDIVTTIDRELQHAAEQSLTKAIQQTNARAGALVAIEADTGAILAMASWPGLDLNNRGEVTADVLRNRAVADVYEPGSTLKAVTVAAAIEEGVIDAETHIDTPESVTIGDFTYEDHGANPDWMTVADVVKRSSNVGTIEIQRRLGDELHYEYLTQFGLGSPAGLDVEGERHGELQPASKWNQTSGSSIAIGYAVGTTPLQMAAVYSTFANDGVWVEPYLVSEIIRPDATRITTKPRSRVVMSEETAATMRAILGRVVEESDGTGRRGKMEDFTAAGKTGTSQQFDVEAGAYSDETFASFVGMAPLNDPRIIVAVVLDAPHGTHEDGADLSLGGASAAPVFAEFTQAALHQLGVAPDRE